MHPAGRRPSLTLSLLHVRIRLMKWRWIVFAGLLTVEPSTFGCELCRDAIVTSAAHTAVSFNGSIYWMLGGLFAVITMVGRLMYKTVNESEARSPDMLRRR